MVIAYCYSLDTAGEGNHMGLHIMASDFECSTPAIAL